MNSRLVRKIKNIREYINIKIYDTKNKVMRIAESIGFGVSVLGILILLYFWGFHVNAYESIIYINILKAIMAIFILKYILGYVYSFTPIDYLKETKFEGILICLAMVGIFLYHALGIDIMKMFANMVYYSSIEEFKYFFIKAYVMLILFIELGKVGSRLPTLKLSPEMILVLSFLILIVIGTAVFMLPQVTKSRTSMSFFEALFTSISASCVTGLTVVDTATYFSFKGHVLLLFLIQLGGLNIISFATIFALFARNNIGIKHRTILQGNLSTLSIRDSRLLLKKIFIFTFVIEVIGTLFIFFTWSEDVVFDNVLQRLFYSLFHSVSAFNNAGFSLFTDGLSSEVTNGLYAMHIVLFILIFLGGIGFTSLQEMLNWGKLKKVFLKKTHKFTMNTKISLYTSISLILFGALLFFVIEYDNVLKAQPWYGKIVSSFFQSVTTRTAGFNTIDIADISKPTIILMLFLMFVGASPGSTGGGIKTNAFALLIIFIYSNIRGKERIETAHHYISYKQFNRAVIMLIFAIGFIFISLFLLTLTNRDIPIMELVFEQVSAFSTVGLSTGVTSDLSFMGKIVIMVSMFVGRIGTITLGLALSRRMLTTQYKYPKAIIQL